MNGADWLVYVSAIAAAGANAGASLLQRYAAARDLGDETRTQGLRLMAVLLRRPRYLAGIGMMVIAFLFQATALSNGSLAVVQPILSLELLFVFLALRFGFGRCVSRPEWAGAIAAVLGLAGFIAFANPIPSTSSPPLGIWLVVTAAVIGAIVFLVWLARRGGAAWRAAVYGVAAGVLFALTAAFMREATLVGSQSIGRVLATWQTYALAVAGAAAVVVAAHAFKVGPLTATQPGLTIVDPVISIVLGLLLFGDHVRSDALPLAAEIISLAVMIGGLTAVARSEAFLGEREDEQEHMIATRSLAHNRRQRQQGRVEQGREERLREERLREERLREERLREEQRRAPEQRGDRQGREQQGRREEKLRDSQNREGHHEKEPRGDGQRREEHHEKEPREDGQRREEHHEKEPREDGQRREEHPEEEQRHEEQRKQQRRDEQRREHEGCGETAA